MPADLVPAKLTVAGCAQDPGLANKASAESQAQPDLEQGQLGAAAEPISGLNAHPQCASDPALEAAGFRPAMSSAPQVRPQQARQAASQAMQAG